MKSLTACIGVSSGHPRMSAATSSKTVPSVTSFATFEKLLCTFRCCFGVPTSPRLGGIFSSVDISRLCYPKRFLSLLSHKKYKKSLLSVHQLEDRTPLFSSSPVLLTAKLLRTCMPSSLMLHRANCSF